jgi:hypothetical protein
LDELNRKRTRNFQKCFESFSEKVIQPNQNYKFYFFAHFWNDNNLNGKVYDEVANIKGSWNEQNLNNFIAINPDAFLIEKPIDFNFEISKDNRFNSEIEKNILSMHYSIQKSFQICEHFSKFRNIIFDKIIKNRTDVFFQKNIILDNFSDALNIKKQYIHTDYGVNDHIALGSMIEMKKYCNVYSNFKHIIDEGCPVLPECILGFNLLKQNAKIEFNLNDEFYICRET